MSTAHLTRLADANTAILDALQSSDISEAAIRSAMAARLPEGVAPNPAITLADLTEAVWIQTRNILLTNDISVQQDTDFGEETDDEACACICRRFSHALRRYKTSSRRSIAKTMCLGSSTRCLTRRRHYWPRHRPTSSGVLRSRILCLSPSTRKVRSAVS